MESPFIFSYAMSMCVYTYIHTVYTININYVIYHHSSSLYISGLCKRLLFRLVDLRCSLRPRSPFFSWYRRPHGFCCASHTRPTCRPYQHEMHGKPNGDQEEIARRLNCTPVSILALSASKYLETASLAMGRICVLISALFLLAIKEVMWVVGKSQTQRCPESATK